MRRLLTIFIAISILIAGCMKKTSTSDSWIVITEISVTREYQGIQTSKTYTNQDKMRQILNALRTLGSKSTPELNPEVLKLRQYTIILVHSDGSEKVYQTKGDRYIRQKPKPWQQADPKKVSELNLLLQSLPGDKTDD